MRRDGGHCEEVECEEFDRRLGLTIDQKVRVDYTMENVCVVNGYISLVRGYLESIQRHVPTRSLFCWLTVRIVM
jgi:hypothetical protein